MSVRNDRQDNRIDPAKADVSVKPERKQPARKAKAGAQPQVDSVTVPFPDTDDDDEARRILADSVPNWEELDRDERAELLRLVRSHRQRGAPAKVTLTRKPDGGWNLKPQDQAKALLLVQMYCTHDAAIRALKQLGAAEWVPTAQTFGNLATKLLRTSQGQMETLARMRRGGEQVVKHVHADNRGGQAVIAENVNQGDGTAKNEDQSHATGNSGSGPALLGHDPQGNGVTIPGGERTKPVQDARRDQFRRA